jgi:hypothetical protein
MAGSVACRTKKVKAKASVEAAAAHSVVPKKKKAKAKGKSKTKPECESQEQIKDTVEIDGGGQRDKFFVDDILDVFNVTVTKVAETRHNLLCKSLVLGAAAHFGITGEINFMGALVF